MQASDEKFSVHVPYYLTGEQKDGLKKALSDFQSSADCEYYLNKYPDQILQGDGWSGLEVIEFDSLKKQAIKGIIISNSCDIETTNSRDAPTKITFAPIIKLSNYQNFLANAGIAEDAANAKIEAIKAQEVTSLFYLPSSGALEEEYVAILQDIQSVPAKAHQENDNCKKLFTLNMFGFYLFTFKLSIHFCRLHEGVDRSK